MTKQVKVVQNLVGDGGNEYLVSLVYTSNGMYMLLQKLVSIFVGDNC